MNLMGRRLLLLLLDSRAPKRTSKAAKTATSRALQRPAL